MRIEHLIKVLTMIQSKHGYDVEVRLPSDSYERKEIIDFMYNESLDGKLATYNGRIAIEPREGG